MARPNPCTFANTRDGLSHPFLKGLFDPVVTLEEPRESPEHVQAPPGDGGAPDLDRFLDPGVELPQNCGATSGSGIATCDLSARGRPLCQRRPAGGAARRAGRERRTRRGKGA